MKKTFIKIFLPISFFISFTANANAQLAVACVNCSTIFQQIPQLIEDAATTIASQASLAQDIILTTKVTVLDQIGNRMVSLAIDRAGNQIINWAKGGFQGQPLLISNPEQYIKNQAVNSVKINLGKIPVDDIFGGSILDSVIKGYKSGNVETQLKDLAKSSLPSITQKNLCSEESLSKISKEQLPEGVSENSQTYRNIKQSLFNEYCKGNPSDPTLARKLSILAKQNNINGLDGILIASSPSENETAKVTKATNLIKQEEELKKEFAIKEIYEGASTVSEKECVKTAETDENGDPYGDSSSAPCEEYSTITPGELVEDQLAKATSASLDRAISLNNSGGGLLSQLVNSAFTLVINKGMGAIFGSTSQPKGSSVPALTIGNTSTSNTSTSNTSSANTTSQQTSSAVYVSPFTNIKATDNDLTNQPETKSNLITPIKDQVNKTLVQIDDLKRLNTDYLSAVLAYKANLNVAKGCYDGIIRDFKRPQSSDEEYRGPVNSGIESDPRILSAMELYKNKMDSTVSLENQIRGELSQIPNYKALNEELLSRVDLSNSTDEILALFTKYTNTSDSLSSLLITKTSTKNGELIRYNFNNTQDQTIPTLTNGCAQLRQDLRSGGGGGE